MDKAKLVIHSLLAPFSGRNGVDIFLILIYGIINGLVLLNAILHDPEIGYDASAHLKYIQTLSELRLPAHTDTQEFFSPPLPYLIPALLQSLTNMELFWAAKIGQLLNVLLSLGLTFFLIKTCQLISPCLPLKLGALGFLGVLPVYYKTFAFVRGEPYVAFFAVVMLYLIVRVLIKKHFCTVSIMSLGAAMGLCFLSRQWGILILPTVAMFTAYQWIRYPQYRRALGCCFLSCVLLSGSLSGWFYVLLKYRYSSVTAFNRAPAEYFTFANQSSSFYTGLGSGLLFSRPIRPSFANQLFPIFYSEIWGDYWGYFFVYGRDRRNSAYIVGMTFRNSLSSNGQPEWLETNYRTAMPYLGRVNIVGLFPSSLFLAAVVFALWLLTSRDCQQKINLQRKELICFVILTIATSVAGYLWFLVMYPNLGKGDTIKATYMLHLIPFAAVLVGLLLQHLEVRAKPLYRLVLVGLCLCFYHNIPSMVTHFSLRSLP